MASPPKLHLNTAYHIYNRGNNRGTLFRGVEDYLAFLAGCQKYVPPVADLFAYSLLGNHFHLALRTFTLEEQALAWERICAENGSTLGEPFLFCEPSQKLGSFFSSYAMRFNHRYHRTGALFERPFERQVVDNDDYLRTLIVYIHRNPETHGLIDDFRHWPYSSYQHYLLPDPDPAQTFILDLFGGVEEFRIAHTREAEEDFPMPALLFPAPVPASAAT